MLAFKVAQKFQRGPEQTIGQFKDEADAKIFIESKLKADTVYNMNASYLLYDFGDLMEEYLPGTVQSSEEEATSQGAGQGNSQVFSPSPFQMAPKPSSMPPSSFKDLLKKDDEK